VRCSTTGPVFLGDPTKAVHPALNRRTVVSRRSV
jgi:hypothetical protein